MSVIWRNRAGNQRALVELRHPTTEPELRDIVGEAASHGRPLKAVGAGLACSDMALTHGILLSLEDYGRVVSLDAERMEVTVQAGARLGEVTRHLAGRGFAFESTGGSAAQTIAGAVATGFSGTGTRSAGLSAAVTGMRLIDAEGVVHETHSPLRSNGAGGSGARGAPHRGEDTAPDSPERLHDVARVGLGALGLISTLTLAVVPAFKLHTRTEVRHMGELLEGFEHLASANDHLELWCSTGSDTAFAKVGRRTHEPATARPRSTVLRERLLSDLLTNRGGTRSRNANRWGPPRLSERRSSLAVRMLPTESDDASPDLLRPEPSNGEVELGYAVPLGETMDALLAIQQWARQRDDPVHLPVAVWVSDGDDSPLSPSYGRKSGHIRIRASRGWAYEELFGAVESIMAEHDGRPHWETLHRRTSDELRGLYPRWAEFQAVRGHMDPTGVFANAYTERCLGSPAS